MFDPESKSKIGSCYLGLLLSHKGLFVKFRYCEKATKFEKNLPHKIGRYSVMSNFTWKIFSNFVAFSEYPNFITDTQIVFELTREITAGGYGIKMIIDWYPMI